MAKEKAKYAKWGKWDEKAPLTLSITYSDKTTVTAAVPKEDFLTHYGMKQWIASKCAGATNLGEYKQIVEEMIDRASRAEWEAEADSLGFLINVVAWDKKLPVETVREAIEALDDDEVAKIRANGDFKIKAANYRAAMLKKANPKPEALVIPGLDKK